VIANYIVVVMDNVAEVVVEVYVTYVVPENVIVDMVNKNR
jgi:hypothetical protein